MPSKTMTNTPAAIVLPDTAELENRSLALVDEARAVEIRSAPAYERAAGFLINVKNLLREIDATFDPILKAQRAALEAARAARAKHAEPVEEAERVVKGKMADWSAKELAARREREAAARAKAEEEARIERDRQVAEAKAAAAQAKADGDKTTAKALQAEAKAIAAAPIIPDAVHVESRRPTVDGVAIRQVWGAEVTDLAALVAYVAGNPQFIGLLLPNGPALNTLARSLKENMAIPGVKASMTTSVAAGCRQRGSDIQHGGMMPSGPEPKP